MATDSPTIYRALKHLVPLLALCVSACQTVSGEPERVYSVADEMNAARTVHLPDLESAYLAATTEAGRVAARNEYIARRMYLVDVAFTEFVTGLTRERQQFGFLSAVAAQGLSTAGAAFTPASTVRVLSALSSGVNASRGFYDSELLQNRAIQIVESQMQSGRDRAAAIILMRAREGTLTYPLSAALIDLENYYRAGTLTSGLAKAVAESAVSAEQSSLVRLAAIRDQARSAVITDVSKPLRQGGRIDFGGAEARGDIEKALSPQKVKQIQRALCVKEPADSFGPLDSPPRLALSEFFAAAGLTPSQTIDNHVQLNKLQAAVSKVRAFTESGTCDRHDPVYRTAADVGAAVRKP